MPQTKTSFRVISNAHPDSSTLVIVASKKNFPLAVDRNRAKRRMRAALYGQAQSTKAEQVLQNTRWILYRPVLSQSFSELKQQVSQTISTLIQKNNGNIVN